MTAGRAGGARRATLPLAAFVLVAACARTSEPPLPPRPAVLDVEMREYRFDHAPVPGGRVVFRMKNVGRLPHRLSLVPLPPDLPPILEQLRGEERQVLFTLAAIAETAPGASGTFAVDLTPGRYAMICFLVDPEGRSHALEGMATEFRVP
jgi:hypothetical protein